MGFFHLAFSPDPAGSTRKIKDLLNGFGVEQLLDKLGFELLIVGLVTPITPAGLECKNG